MVTYCEGAKAAEIIFSLTGGREGRLMSYAPPVTITIGGGLFFTVKGVSFPIGGFIAIVGDTETEAYRLYYDDWNYSQIMFTKFISVNDGEYVVLGIGYSEQESLHRIGYDVRITDFQDTIVRSEILAEYKLYERPNLFGYLGLSTGLKRRALIISDMEGILYFHEIPEGFTPTWQVNCIGCNPGECAGSDGKGGVVCMDCGQIDRDLKVIKKSLSS